MRYKENNTIGSSMSTISVKPEPRETVITPLTRSDSLNQESDSSTIKTTQVKTETTNAARVVGALINRDAMCLIGIFTLLQFIERGLPVPMYAQQNVKSSSQTHTAQQGVISTKAEDANMDDGIDALAATLSRGTCFSVYTSPKDIKYTPEKALKEGLGMVTSIKASLKHLQLGSKLRQEVWMREIDRCVHYTTVSRE
ncbi:hypothetical protein H0H87_005666 [Tephrocybe sp. NHM501043]|nr:hypothetical protein H0H87_005666 [Tephrocybe sp. NHM501043]